MVVAAKDVDQFVAVSGGTRADAERFLEAAAGNLSLAVELFLDSGGAPAAAKASAEQNPNSPENRAAALREQLDKELKSERVDRAKERPSRRRTGSSLEPEPGARSSRRREKSERRQAAAVLAAPQDWGSPWPTVATPQGWGIPASIAWPTQPAEVIAPGADIPGNAAGGQFASAFPLAVSIPTSPVPVVAAPPSPMPPASVPASPAPTVAAPAAATPGTAGPAVAPVAAALPAPDPPRFDDAILRALLDLPQDSLVHVLCGLAQRRPGEFEYAFKPLAAAGSVPAAAVVPMVAATPAVVERASVPLTGGAPRSPVPTHADAVSARSAPSQPVPPSLTPATADVAPPMLAPPKQGSPPAPFAAQAPAATVAAAPAATAAPPAWPAAAPCNGCGSAWPAQLPIAATGVQAAGLDANDAPWPASNPWPAP
eukprot:CAMPEP_0115523256 /NCGR_PEP_ID=MMETSP0271-20121206/80530_1 /TAXON_ID=71861 /ORGANISM="Scrippsiella trochoidea, Strain CCMP3099" /LENGTH=427 /DNA_ID=CAMNT_0002954637 /DNA_START=92 /DNA_END=1371 /DNA_ORIENTATION=-